MEDRILHGKRKFINVSFVAPMSEGLQQATLAEKKETGSSHLPLRTNYS
jgi:hypothetical protein